MLKFSLRTLLCITLITSLIGCGFHLRGTSDVSFSSIFIQGNTLTISKNLIKSLTTNGVKVLESEPRSLPVHPWSRNYGW